jgi:hypothetical protein
MGKLDVLSRRADHGNRCQDNDNMTLLDPSLFQIHALSGINIIGGEQAILRNICHSLSDNELEEYIAKTA